MAPADDDRRLVARLRAGDEAAFAALVDRHHAALRRLAVMFVPSVAIAEEVVQDAWVAMLDGLAGFEGRSSVKTWLFRVLINRARTRGQREARVVAAAELTGPEEMPPAVDPRRFNDRGRWAAPLARWDADTPETLLLRHELSRELEAALRALPERQRTVVVLRDALGWTAEEVCNVLDIQETNQRVLLHRARARLRDFLEHSQGQG
jgi:RNA polymerase sigma-70 factor, ECF subfamily